MKKVSPNDSLHSIEIEKPLVLKTRACISKPESLIRGLLQNMKKISTLWISNIIFLQCGGEINLLLCIDRFQPRCPVYNSQELLLKTLRSNCAPVQETVMWSYTVFLCVRKQKFLSFAASNQKSFDLSVEIRPPLASRIQETKSFGALRRLTKFIIHCSKSLWRSIISAKSISP